MRGSCFISGSEFEALAFSLSLVLDSFLFACFILRLWKYCLQNVFRSCPYGAELSYPNQNESFGNRLNLNVLLFACCTLHDLKHVLGNIMVQCIFAQRNHQGLGLLVLDAALEYLMGGKRHQPRGYGKIGFSLFFFNQNLVLIYFSRSDLCCGLVIAEHCVLVSVPSPCNCSIASLHGAGPPKPAQPKHNHWAARLSHACCLPLIAQVFYNRQYLRLIPLTPSTVHPLVWIQVLFWLQ